ncbi:MAG: Hsp20/alpha crystallin family protein [Bdellovibrionales bacterium]|nr:Hsp20/alpha crystallin family protein [Bdellovibrionales bacterium]
MRRSLLSNNLPYASTWNLMKEFDDILNEFSTPTFTRGEYQTHFEPKSEVKETETGYLLSFDVPGVKEDDIKIEFADRVLKIYGERKEENKVEKDGFFRTEKVYGKFERSFRLPENVNDNKIEANYSQGVLQVYLPKETPKTAKMINISNEPKSFMEKLIGKKEENH